MGSLVSAMSETLKKLLDFFSGWHGKILMLGLDGTGKTTILYRLKLNETVTTYPTFGVNVETVQPVENVSFTVWDVCAAEKVRPLWRTFFPVCEGLLYVIDSTDKSRFQEAKKELDRVLECEELDGVPVVILANKQDLPEAATASDVEACLGMHLRQERKWLVQGTSATSGEGIYEAMQNLSLLVKEYQALQRR